MILAMNKAFVREPDQGEEYCPRCGAAGQPVNRSTIAAQVVDATQISVAEVANFCPTPTCDVAYFDMFERVITVDALRRGVYPKDPDAPICACFGLTTADIDQDLADGVVTRTKACLLKAQSPESRCHETAANGRSCVAEVQRYFVQRKSRS